MDIEGECRVINLSHSFELDTWADAEKAKIHRMAEAALESLKGPPKPRTWDDELTDLLRNSAPPQPSQSSLMAAMQMQNDPYFYQQHGDPFCDLFGGAFGYSRCQCCGR